MLNWIDYRKELFGRIGEMSKLAPDSVKAYQAMSSAGQKTDLLGAKTRELIALGRACRKAIVDRALHQGARRRGAALTVEGVDHEEHGIERPVEVGVVEDDDGVLAAELEVHPLQCRRALLHLRLQSTDL